VVSIMGPDVYAAATAGILRSPPSSAHARLGETGVPVLVLAATLPEETHPDRTAAAARFQQLVPQAELRWLEETPHFVLEDKPEETARAVGEWLASLAYA
jgi:pimeloyl-ACP methyl ester carboxylesterase